MVSDQLCDKRLISIGNATLNLKEKKSELNYFKSDCKKPKQSTKNTPTKNYSGVDTQEFT